MVFPLVPLKPCGYSQLTTAGKFIAVAFNRERDG